MLTEAHRIRASGKSELNGSQIWRLSQLKQLILYTVQGQSVVQYTPWYGSGYQPRIAHH